MKKYVWFTFICVLCAGLALWSLTQSTVSYAQATPQRPFPQHVTYAPNTIKPTNYSQAAMDQHVRTFYDDWKSKFVTPAGANQYRIAFGWRDMPGTEPWQQQERANFYYTVSEGQGYGMVIVALMAGHDPQAQTIFDGLWNFARQYPSGADNRLMSWKIQHNPTSNSYTIVEGNNNAFDGDADIAYALILADAQWGSNGAINYRQAANSVIAGMMAKTVGPQSKLPTLGDWVNYNGSPHSQYTPRTSDFIPSYFRAYARVSGDTTWNQVVSSTQSALNNIQANHSATTGLLPDFLMGCNSSCQPAAAEFLEGPHDGHYYYNAGRNPWRLATDVLINNDTTSRNQVKKLVGWVAQNSGGQAVNIKAGYQLNGTAIDSYFSTFFAAPLGVGAMTDPTQQAFLNNIYQNVYNTHEGYFADSVNLLSLLVMTGNFWDPTTTGTPVTPQPTATPSRTPSPTATRTPSPTPTRACPTLTPEPFWIEPVQSPTNVNHQVLRVHLGNGEYVRAIGPAGEVTVTQATNGVYLVDVPLATNSSNSIQVQGKTRQINGCGGYTLTQTVVIVHQGSQNGTCTVTYRVDSQWSGGFTATVNITNNGTAAINGWNLKFNFPSNQQVSQLWNGSYSQTGQQMTVNNASWNGTIPAGGSTSFGFLAIFSGSNVNPTSFTLNNAPCS